MQPKSQKPHRRIMTMVDMMDRFFCVEQRNRVAFRWLLDANFVSASRFGVSDNEIEEQNLLFVLHTKDRLG